MTHNQAYACADLCVDSLYLGLSSHQPVSQMVSPPSRLMPIYAHAHPINVLANATGDQIITHPILVTRLISPKYPSLVSHWYRWLTSSHILLSIWYMNQRSLTRPHIQTQYWRDTHRWCVHVSHYSNVIGSMQYIVSSDHRVIWFQGQLRVHQRLVTVGKISKLSVS